MLSGISSVLSFLTLFPTGNGSLDTAARNMHLFPLAGIVLGAALGALGFGISEAGLDPLVVALVLVAVTAIATGVHHTDGLGDFADGLMAKGTVQKKLSVMRDASTGSAGAVAISLYVAGMIVALSLAGGWHLLIVVLVAEILAKFSMVLLASSVPSAAPGSSSPFLAAMRDRKRLAFAVVTATFPVLMFGGIAGLFAMVAVVVLTAFVARLALRSFGGVTGDVLGAMNEISRLVAVLVLVSA